MSTVDYSALIPIDELPKKLPRRNGKQVHRSTIYRWIDRGIKGVVLRSELIGGLRYTRIEWLQEFVEARNRRQSTAPTKEEEHKAHMRQVAANAYLASEGF